jgi:hypothetical protein
MDAAPCHRKFPGYTLAELEAAVAAGRGTPVMEAEIAARKDGTSVHYKVPQVEGGKPVARIGRM